MAKEKKYGQSNLYDEAPMSYDQRMDVTRAKRKNKGKSKYCKECDIFFRNLLSTAINYVITLTLNNFLLMNCKGFWFSNFFSDLFF